MTHRGHHGEGEHDERNVSMPTVPRAGLVVRQPKLGLDGLKRILDGPAPALDAHKGVDRRTGWAPRREVGPLAVGEAAPDEEPARPRPGPGRAIVVGPEVSQLTVSPLVEPLAFSA